MVDPNTFTMRVNQLLVQAQSLALEHGHQQLSPVHVGIT